VRPITRLIPGLCTIVVVVLVMVGLRCVVAKDFVIVQLALVA